MIWDKYYFNLYIHNKPVYQISLRSILLRHVLQVELSGSDIHKFDALFFKLIISGQDPELLLLRTATWIENLNNLFFFSNFCVFEKLVLSKCSFFTVITFSIFCWKFCVKVCVFDVYACSLLRNSKFPNLFDEWLILMSSISNIGGNILDLRVSWISEALFYKYYFWRPQSKTSSELKDLIFLVLTPG